MAANFGVETSFFLGLGIELQQVAQTCLFLACFLEFLVPLEV